VFGAFVHQLPGREEFVHHDLVAAADLQLRTGAAPQHDAHDRRIRRVAPDDVVVLEIRAAVTGHWDNLSSEAITPEIF
jgi:hypothetical protein